MHKISRNEHCFSLFHSIVFTVAQRIGSEIARNGLPAGHDLLRHHVFFYRLVVSTLLELST